MPVTSIHSPLLAKVCWIEGIYQENLAEFLGFSGDCDSVAFYGTEESSIVINDGFFIDFGLLDLWQVWINEHVAPDSGLFAFLEPTGMLLEGHALLIDNKYQRVGVTSIPDAVRLVETLNPLNAQPRNTAEFAKAAYKSLFGKKS